MTFCKEFSMTSRFKTNVSFAVPKDSSVEKGRSNLLTIKNNEEEQVSLRARATLMLVIIDHIKAKKLTQTKAATLCQITQPGMSNLMTGKIENFSLDRLVVLVKRLGIKVQIDALEETVS